MIQKSNKPTDPTTDSIKTTIRRSRSGGKKESDDLFATHRAAYNARSHPLDDILPPDKDSTIAIESIQSNQPQSSQLQSSQLSKPAIAGFDSQPKFDQLQSSQLNHSQLQSGQLSEGRLEIIKALPEIKGDARIPNQILDHLLRFLPPFEQAVYLQLYRLSWGNHAPNCRISNENLGKRANVSLAKVKQITASLEVRGLIKKVARPHGNNIFQGVEYQVFAPSWQIEIEKQQVDRLRRSQPQSSQPQSSQPQSSYNKINNNKEINKEELRDCPDCFGLGWYYPGGKEKGAKNGCPHTNLKKRSSSLK